MDETIDVGKALWVFIESARSFDGLFALRDDVGGEVLIDAEEIPSLIEALKKVQEKYKEAKS